MRTPLAVLFLLGAISALIVSGCGGGGAGNSESIGASATEGAPSVTQGKVDGGSGITGPPPLKPPNKMPITQGLRQTPPPNKKVIYLQCELPECQRSVKGLEDATAALGWSEENLVYSALEPGAGLAQAIARGPDFIAITGVPTSLMKSQMEAAHRAGIPVVSCSTPEKPSTKGFVSQCGGSLQLDAEYVGAWMADDSGDNAHVLGVTLPEYPVLATETETLKEELPKLCSGCTYEELDLTEEDVVSGGVGAKVVAYLQLHPETNYVYATFNDIAIGLPSILKSAGVSPDKVKITGASAAPATIQQIPGAMAAWTIEPLEYMSWVMVDTMARLANGEKLPPDYQEQIYKTPTWVVSSAAARESLKPYGYDWPGPGDGSYKEDFEKLWKVR